MKTKRIKKAPSLASQVKSKSSDKSVKSQLKKTKKKKKGAGDYKGNFDNITSTGSTELDLAITGEVTPEGGLPSGILVELFGPNSSGKTVLLLEMGGYIQRKGGDTFFNDPEGRINTGFAKQFGYDMTNIPVKEPDTVTGVFKNFRNWDPPKNGKVHGFLIDSLAALSTDMEMDKEEGDKMGGRRGKEYSEGFRKSCREIKKNDYLMLASNQIRDSFAPVGEKFATTGGKAVGFYASVRLRLYAPEKIRTKEKKIGKKLVKKVVGTKVKVEVYKNSCDVAYRTAHIYIMNGYGIDDIRANLQYVKDYTNNNTYQVRDLKLDPSLDKACQMVENQNLEGKLKKEVIELWHMIEDKFKIERKPKKR